MKALKILAAVVLGLTLVTSVACSGESESPSTTPTPTVTGVNVDDSDSGGEKTLAVGDLLIVTLDSNATTGYSWNLSEISDAAIIRYVSDEYVAPEQSDPPVVGAPGEEVWTFEALAAGTAAISMRYIQPWMPDADPAETFDITVIVE
ncbi:MAG: protease inhibitor I42 family protein [Dehalococcoidia bacterium]